MLGLKLNHVSKSGHSYRTFAREFQGFIVWEKIILWTLELTGTTTNLVN